MNKWMNEKASKPTGMGAGRRRHRLRRHRRNHSPPVNPELRTHNYLQIPQTYFVEGPGSCQNQVRILNLDSSLSQSDKVSPNPNGPTCHLKKQTEICMSHAVSFFNLLIMEAQIDKIHIHRSKHCFLWSLSPNDTKTIFWSKKTRDKFHSIVQVSDTCTTLLYFCPFHRCLLGAWVSGRRIPSC